MIKRYATLVAALLFCSCISLRTYAQTWDWGVGSINGPTGATESWPIGVDAIGNVYTTGLVGNFGGSGTTTASFGVYSVSTVSNEQTVLVSTDSNGVYRWALCGQGTGSQPIALVTDSSGNVYLLGSYALNIVLGTLSISGSSQSAFLAKINSLGNVLWLDNIDNAGNAYATSLAIDASGGLYVAGAFDAATITIGSTTLYNHDPINGTTDIFIAKFNTSGNGIWANSFGGDSSEQALTIAATKSGEVYLAGTFNSDTMVIGNTITNPTAGTVDYLFLAKCDTGGNPLWVQKVVASDIPNWNIGNITTDNWDNVYLPFSISDTVMFDNDTLYNSLFEFQTTLSAYGPTGNLKFAQLLNTAGYPGSYQVYCAAADNCGNIWVSGSGGTTSDGSFLTEFDTTGNIISRLYPPTGGDDVNNITVDNKGHLYVGGDYMETFIYIGPDTLNLSSGADESLFILKLSYPYNFCPACAMPLVSFTDTGTNTFGFTYTGTTSGIDSIGWNYGDDATDTGITTTHTYSASGTYTVCVTAYTACGSESYCNTVTIYPESILALSGASLKVFPNPAINELSIIMSPGAYTSCTVTNNVGQQMIQQQLNSTQTIVNVATLPPGLYYITFKGDNGTTVQKFVKM